MSSIPSPRVVGERIRALRTSKGWSQMELASRSGVSRQLVGALETGRHTPRVDAALAIAMVLGVDIADLFGSAAAPVDVVTGASPPDGTSVRIGSVGDRIVTTPPSMGVNGWEPADAYIVDGEPSGAENHRPGVVIAGCEPGLLLIERMQRESGRAGLSVATSSRSAVRALAAGRVHAAVVHGADGSTPTEGDAQVQQALLTPNPVIVTVCRWRVGLAAPAPGSKRWFDRALSGATQVVQREQGAGVQDAFERASAAPIDGPRVGGHVEAVRVAIAAGIPAVTIEPVAVAFGVPFHPLETHVVRVWVAREWITDPAVELALHELASHRFRSRLASIGGYDLSEAGTVVA
jgi:DNA-binding XRE family transcriptional regulator/molybdate-binding protein